MWQRALPKHRLAIAADQRTVSPINGVTVWRPKRRKLPAPRSHRGAFCLAPHALRCVRRPRQRRRGPGLKSLSQAGKRRAQLEASGYAGLVRNYNVYHIANTINACIMHAGSPRRRLLEVAEHRRERLHLDPARSGRHLFRDAPSAPGRQPAGDNRAIHLRLVWRPAHRCSTVARSLRGRRRGHGKIIDKIIGAQTRKLP